MNTLTPRETARGWILPIAGRRITRCVIDFALTFEFWIEENRLSSIRIGTPFEIKHGDALTRLNPEVASELAPAISLFQKEVRRAFAARDGSLELEFTDETILRVPPHSSFEAWEALLDDGTMIVSQPGGIITTWSRP